MKKVLSIIMALVIAIGTFSVMASAYTFGSYITDGKYLLEPGYDIGSAPSFALGERIYGIVEENETACYRFSPTTNEIITFTVQTSDEIEFTISKNGSNDKHTFSVTDTESKLYKLDKGSIYLVTVTLSEAVVDRDYGTMSADAAPAVAHGDDLSDWTDIQSGAAVTPGSGMALIMVAEVDAEGKAVGTGIAKINMA